MLALFEILSLEGYSDYRDIIVERVGSVSDSDFFDSAFLRFIDFVSTKQRVFSLWFIKNISNDSLFTN